MFPKNIYFYWAGNEMSFLRYMTFYSFRKYHPDWNIYLYLDYKLNESNPTWDNTQDYKYSISKNYLNELSKINVIIKEYNEIENFDFFKKAYPAHKSDMFSYKILSDSGGIYSDTDILFIKPIDGFLSDLEKQKIDIGLSYTKTIPGYHFPVGFFIGSDSIKSKEFYNFLYKKCFDNFNINDYQCFGTHLLEKEFKNINNISKIINEIKIFNFDRHLVYVYDHLLVKELWSGLKLPLDNTVGIHWYGGSPITSRFNSIINEDNYTFFNSIICKKIKTILS